MKGRPKLAADSPTVATGLKLPEKLLRALRARCAAEGVTVGAKVRELIKTFLRGGDDD